MQIAVTGASGFVGRALISYLVKNGFLTVEISRADLLADCGKNTVIGCNNFGNSSTLERLLTGCDAVIHLAARAHQIDEELNAESLRLYYDANVDPVIAVANASRIAGVRRMVLVSSIAVNGIETHGKPFTESDEPAPVHPYGVTKLEAERAISQVLMNCDTDWVVLRPSLVYGPGCPGNMARLIKLASVAPLLPFGAINAPRTLISIDNLIDALILAVICPAVSRKIYVLADEHDVTVASILKALLMGLGKGQWRLFSLPILLLAWFSCLSGKASQWQKLSGALQVDASLFRATTGWIPRVNSIQGLQAAAAYSANKKKIV